MRQAILDANTLTGADSILFSVSGTINLLSALPAIVDTVEINALSTQSPPTPTVGIQASGFAGLVFDPGSTHSRLAGLSVAGASGDGITLNDSNIKIQNCYIGLGLDGTTVLGNGADGIRINANTRENLIGRVDPVEGIDYYTPSNPVSFWQGIRGSDTPGAYLLSGTLGDNGMLFEGTIDGVGTYTTINYPGAATTSIYGPNQLANGEVQLVGCYKNPNASSESVVVNGFLYHGPKDGTGVFTTVNYPDSAFNFIHSTMGGLAVGNGTFGSQNGLPVGAGKAFLYDIGTKSFTDIVFPDSISNTAYGIWHNGRTSYTIVGGFSSNPVNNLLDPNTPIGQAFMVDYDSLTKQFSHWTEFNYRNDGLQVDIVTHFEGISGVENGLYTLNANSAQINSAEFSNQGSFVTVRRNPGGEFSNATWVDLDFTPPVEGQNITSSNSVYGNQVVGQVFSEEGSFPFQATITSTFQLSNVISGNAGNGIGIYGANDNHIAMNYIGTDVTGNIDLGNGQNGILITDAAPRNVIGGQATGGNDPTGDVFYRPPMGNLISGNEANGVLINDLSTLNFLSGNFIGTTSSGNEALGNGLDGIAIENADRNEIIGCTLNQNPFVFYNVSSGNGGNGIRIKDSDDIIVHANFLGAGANNATMVPNALNGILVEGNSQNTQVGGVIPLGNVCAGNVGNGIEVKDQVSGFVSFNTFAGLFAFGIAAPNGADGILVTSTGGNNTLRTNVASGNLGNGIHISGEAQGVLVDPNMVGLNTDGSSPMPNGRNGILIDGNAHHNTIGGTYQSVISQNTFSGNTEAGISFQGTAHSNIVYNAVVGLSDTKTSLLGNTLGGIILGPGTYENVIGSTADQPPNYIGGNGGEGILIDGSNNNLIRNTILGITDRLPFAPNEGNGILVRNGNQNQIGDNGSPNTIAFQRQNGIEFESGSQNRILGNSIYGNTELGISLLPGANNDQVAPFLSAAHAPNPTTLTIEGGIHADPNSVYLIQIYGNPHYPASFEGKNPLGTLLTTTDSTGTGLFTYNKIRQPGEGLVYTAIASDRTGNTSEFSNPIILAESKIYAVGAGPGGAPVINIYNALTNKFVRNFLAYDAGFTGGVRVTLGDLTGDEIPEIIATPGAGGGPNVRVFDSITGRRLPGPLGSFMAFSEGFTGGVFAAVGDLNEDGQTEIICGAGAGGGPNVRVFSGTNASLIKSFYAFDSRFTGGVSVAGLDVGGGDSMDIICGAGEGGGPNVRIFDGYTNALISSFFAFDPEFSGGVFVAAGDVDGNGFADVIVGAGTGGPPEVVVFNGGNFGFTKIGSFNAYDPGFKGGVRVGAVSSGSGEEVNILTGPGPGGGPEVRIFEGATFKNLDDFFAFDQGFLGGVFVGGFEPFRQHIR